MNLPVHPLTGQRVGYARISSASQNLDGQLDALNAAGCEKIFSDTASGRLAERPELTLCLGYLRANGGVGYWNCPNTGPARRAACIAWGAHIAHGQADPHHRRAQRAEERKRRGSTLLPVSHPSHSRGRAYHASDAIVWRFVLVRQLSPINRRRHPVATLTWSPAVSLSPDAIPEPSATPWSCGSSTGSAARSPKSSASPSGSTTWV
ncbi:MAG: recombinase family protein [Pseudonocardiaceae bacterium]